MCRVRKFSVVLFLLIGVFSIYAVAGALAATPDYSHVVQSIGHFAPFGVRYFWSQDGYDLYLTGGHLKAYLSDSDQIVWDIPGDDPYPISYDSAFVDYVGYLGEGLVWDVVRLKEGCTFHAYLEARDVATGQRQAMYSMGTFPVVGGGCPPPASGERLIDAFSYYDSDGERGVITFVNDYFGGASYINYYRFDGNGFELVFQKVFGSSILMKHVVLGPVEGQVLHVAAYLRWYMTSGQSDYLYFEYISIPDGNTSPIGWFAIDKTQYSFEYAEGVGQVSDGSPSYWVMIREKDLDTSKERVDLFYYTDQWYSAYATVMEKMSAHLFWLPDDRVWLALGISDSVVVGPDHSRYLNLVYLGPDYQKANIYAINYGDSGSYILYSDMTVGYRKADTGYTPFVVFDEGVYQFKMVDNTLPGLTLKNAGAYYTDGSGCRYIYKGQVALEGTVPDRGRLRLKDAPELTVPVEAGQSDVWLKVVADDGLDSEQTVSGQFYYDRAVADFLGGGYAFINFMPGYDTGTSPVDIGCFHYIPTSKFDVSTAGETKTDQPQASVVVSSHLTQGGQEGYFPTPVGVKIYVNSEEKLVDTVPSGMHPDGYTISGIPLEEGENQVMLRLLYPSGPETVEVNAGPMEFEYHQMYKPTVSATICDGTVKVSGQAPLDTVHILLDGTELVTASHAGGAYEYQFEAEVGHHQLEVYSTWYKYESPHATATLTVRPLPPLLQVPAVVSQPEVPVKVYLQQGGLLKVYLDDSEIFQGQMSTGTHTISVSLPHEGTFVVSAVVEVSGVKSPRSKAQVTYGAPLTPPQLSVPHVTTEEDVPVGIISPISGVAYIYVDTAFSASLAVTASVEATAHVKVDWGEHVITVLVKGQQVTPAAFAAVVRIPPPPQVDIPQRTYHRRPEMEVFSGVDGMLRVEIGGKVFRYRVNKGPNAIRLQFEDRGFWKVSMRLCIGDVCGYPTTGDVFVYDRLKLWIGRRTYLRNDGQGLMDVAPFIDPTVGRTLVPLRFVAEGLGFEVNWHGDTRTIEISGLVYSEESGSTEQITVYMHMPLSKPEMHGGYKVYPGSPKVKVVYESGEVKEIDLRNYQGQDMGVPVIYNSRTMVPVRFVSEIFGAKVLWDGTERSVTIEY